MKKRKNYKILTLGTLVMFNSITPVIANANPNENFDNKDFSNSNTVDESNLPNVEKNPLNNEFPLEIQNELNLMRRKILKAEQTKDIMDLNEAINSYEKISKMVSVEEDNTLIYINLHKAGDDLDVGFELIKDLIYKLPESFLDAKFEENELKRFQNTKSKKIYDYQRMLAGLSKNIYGTGFFKYYTKILYEKNDWKVDLLNPHLKRLYLWSLDNKYPNAKPGEEGITPVDPNVPDLPDGGEDELVDPDKDPNPKPDKPIPGKDFFSESKTYKKIGDKCYEEITHYKNGKEIKKNKKETLKENYVYCGIYDYIDMGGGLGYYGDNIVIPNNPGENGNWDYVVNDQNVESNLTLQFTLERTKEKPYYFDTGMRTNLKGEASFEQIKDVLFQVAVKSKGYVIEDKDKILIVIEEKPIVVKKTKALYNKSDLKEIFKDFSEIEVTIQKTRIGDKKDLETNLENKLVSKLKVDNKDVEMQTIPLVKNNRALFSLEDISNVLNLTYKFNKKENKVILTKDKSTFEFIINSDIAIFNGEEVKLESKPEYKEGIFMAEINGLIKELGYDLIWDGDTSTISINKK